MTIHVSHIHLDMRVEATGVHDAGTTTWTTPVPFYGTHAVVVATGTLVTLTGTLGGTSFTATGDYTGAAVLGTPYEMEVEIARPVPREDNGTPMHTERFLLKRITLIHNEPSGFDVKFVPASPWSTRTATYAGSFTAPSERLHRFLTTIGLKAENTRIMFTNNTWRPCRIHGYEIAAEVQGGLR